MFESIKPVIKFDSFALTQIETRTFLLVPWRGKRHHRHSLLCGHHSRSTRTRTNHPSSFNQLRTLGGHQQQHQVFLYQRVYHRRYHHYDYSNGQSSVNEWNQRAGQWSREAFTDVCRLYIMQSVAPHLSGSAASSAEHRWSRESWKEYLNLASSFVDSVRKSGSSSWPGQVGPN